MKYIFCSAFFMFHASLSLASPGDCMAERYFNAFPDAPNFVDEQKCIEIDISESYDSLGVNIEYHWDLGDGKQMEGMKVNHCYKDFGRYQASLSVKIPERKYLSENEMSLNVLIKEGVRLEIGASGDAEQDSLMSFTARLSPLITYDLKDVFWDFGDGMFACGEEKIPHVYKEAGRYKARVLVVLSNQDGEIRLADELLINVKSYNVFGASLAKYFISAGEIPEVRFLDEPIRLVALDKEEKIVRQLQVSAERNYNFTLPPGQKYTIYLWKGNKFASPQSLNAASFQDTLDCFKAINKLMEKMVASPPTELHPLYFEYNELEVNTRAKKTLNENIKALGGLPYAKIMVGSHTHTEGPRDINISYSQRRSENIKKEITNESKGNLTVEVVSPEQDDRLINSCFDNYDCGNEDDRLNRRSDLKIVSIGSL